VFSPRGAPSPNWGGRSSRIYIRGGRGSKSSAGVYVGGARRAHHVCVLYHNNNYTNNMQTSVAPLIHFIIRSLSPSVDRICCFFVLFYCHFDNYTTYLQTRFELYFPKSLQVIHGMCTVQFITFQCICWSIIINNSKLEIRRILKTDVYTVKYVV